MVNERYTTNIKENAEIAREAEEIVIDLLGELITDRQFFSVHDDEECWHLGDIIDTKGKYYDAKDDGRIHKTGNVFAEDRKFWNDGTQTDGWMRNGQYDYLCILDRVKKKIYVLDFNKLKKVYRGGRYITTNMGDNVTAGFCYPLSKCRKNGILLYETSYDYDEDWGYFVDEI